MNIIVTEIHHTPNSTLSTLTIEGSDFTCYVLEDGQRAKKIMHRTRIPAGRYQVLARQVGRIFNNYKRRFGVEFVPWLQDVPGFEYILIHIGNTISDSSGCLLLGYQFEKADDYMVKRSTLAFLDFYTIVKAAFHLKEEVWIEIKRMP